MDPLSRRRCRPAAIFTITAMLGILLCGAIDVVAQEQSASIIGQVTDESKGVLPGVTVTATSPALQLPQLVVVTDERGEYRLTPLPIGTYTVEYALAGFRTVRREGIRLTAGFTAKVDLVMAIGGLEQAVTVSGASPLVDVAATNTETQLTREKLDLLPTIRESLTGLLQLVPGARPGLQPAGASFQNFNTNAFGRADQPWQSLDGVVTVNPRASQSGNMFDFSSFEEATVATIGHDASVPNAGPFINTVIKSGANDFHWGAYYAGGNSAFEADSLMAGGLKTTVKDEYSAELGGRVVRDKVWFWVGGRLVRDYKQLTDTRVCLKPDGSPCDNVAYQRYLTVKPTFQLNPSHRFIGFYYMGIGRNRSVGNLASWDSRRDHNFRPSAGKAEWQWVHGGSFVLTTNVGAWSAMSGSVCPDSPDRTLQRDVSANDLSMCTGVATTDTVTKVVTGLDPRTGERTQEGRVQFRSNASYYKPDWFHGNHELKAGVEIFNAPQNRINIGRGAAGNDQLVFQNGVPIQVLFWNYPIHPALTLRYYSGYVADSWTIGRKLTLNLGARYALDEAYESPTCRVAADYPSATIYPAQCFTEVRLPDYRTFVPRLRASYDISGNGRTVVKGGWGRYALMRTSDMVDIAAKQTGASTTYKWHDLNGDRNYEPGEVNLDPNGSDFVSRLGAAAIASSLQGGVVNPDETAPYEDEYSLQFERQLNDVIAVRATGVWTRALNQIRVGNTLRPYSAYTVPIVNPIPNQAGVVPAGNALGTITYWDYPTAYAGLAFQRPMYVNDATADQDFRTMEFAVSKRLSRNWQFQTSYTATKIHIPFVANAGAFNTQDPNAEIFAANDTWEWQFRASGSYLMPLGFQASANFEHRSGDPWARTAQFKGGVQIPTITLRVEPIGSERLPNINMMNMRLEKQFKFGAQNLSVGLNFFNAFNTQVATAITAQSGPNYGVVTTRVAQRRLEVQAQYRY